MSIIPPAKMPKVKYQLKQSISGKQTNIRKWVMLNEKSKELKSIKGFSSLISPHCEVQSAKENPKGDFELSFDKNKQVVVLLEKNLGVAHLFPGVAHWMVPHSEN